MGDGGGGIESFFVEEVFTSLVLDEVGIMIKFWLLEDGFSTGFVFFELLRGKASMTTTFLSEPGPFQTETYRKILCLVLLTILITKREDKREIV